MMRSIARAKVTFVLLAVVVATLANAARPLEAEWQHLDDESELASTSRQLLGKKDRSYKDGQPVPLWASKVGPFTNPRGQKCFWNACNRILHAFMGNIISRMLRTLETYEYYALPYCPPTEGIKWKTLGLGELVDANRQHSRIWFTTHLFICAQCTCFPVVVDRMATTPFKLNFKEELNNEIACEKKLGAEEQLKFRKANTTSADIPTPFGSNGVPSSILCSAAADLHVGSGEDRIGKERITRQRRQAQQAAKKDEQGNKFKDEKGAVRCASPEKYTYRTSYDLYDSKQDEQVPSSKMNRGLLNKGYTVHVTPNDVQCRRRWLCAREQLVLQAVVMCTRTVCFAGDEGGLAVREDWYFQMYYDDLPVWGFIGKMEKIITTGSKPLYKYYLFTHIDFDIKYNGKHVIEISVSTDPHQVRGEMEKEPEVCALHVQLRFACAAVPTNPHQGSKQTEHAEYYIENPCVQKIEDEVVFVSNLILRGMKKQGGGEGLAPKHFEHERVCWAKVEIRHALCVVHNLSMRTCSACFPGMPTKFEGPGYAPYEMLNHCCAQTEHAELLRKRVLKHILGEVGKEEGSLKYVPCMCSHVMHVQQSPVTQTSRGFCMRSCVYRPLPGDAGDEKGCLKYVVCLCGSSIFIEINAFTDPSHRLCFHTVCPQCLGWKAMDISDGSKGVTASSHRSAEKLKPFIYSQVVDISDGSKEVTAKFTYSVHWTPTETTFENRLQRYERFPLNPIHLEWEVCTCQCSVVFVLLMYVHYHSFGAFVVPGCLPALYFGGPITCACQWNQLLNLAHAVQAHRKYLSQSFCKTAGTAHTSESWSKQPVTNAWCLPVCMHNALQIYWFSIIASCATVLRHQLVRHCAAYPCAGMVLCRPIGSPSSARAPLCCIINFCVTVLLMCVHAALKIRWSSIIISCPTVLHHQVLRPCAVSSIFASLCCSYPLDVHIQLKRYSAACVHWFIINWCLCAASSTRASLCFVINSCVTVLLMCVLNPLQIHWFSPSSTRVSLCCIIDFCVVTVLPIHWFSPSSTRVSLCCIIDLCVTVLLMCVHYADFTGSPPSTRVSLCCIINLCITVLLVCACDPLVLIINSCVAMLCHQILRRRVARIHWFSIINSCVTVLLLTGFLATILMRVLKADFIKYSRDDRTMDRICVDADFMKFTCIVASSAKRKTLKGGGIMDHMLEKAHFIKYPFDDRECTNLIHWFSSSTRASPCCVIKFCAAVLLVCVHNAPQIHWFSIINSCVTVLLLTGFLATILMRVLKADFIKYSRDDRTMDRICVDADFMKFTCIVASSAKRKTLKGGGIMDHMLEKAHFIKYPFDDRECTNLVARWL
ncbi:hypothetical protein DUNSADRAFT_13422 [Dunaliella salina]|uniref:Uncharacterized protein n=1 Tax=Dunaliella salina TaxID=3046 RepID=A0ABQ7H3A3_DUNSA|nr:hypothetical protein DUNSADRAFT_13422 [Dunaliella salina]|eukprot:KAF5841346.1 hypothetical protein DUNSADRAFT_13422 [Dunaliella salina]